MSSTRTAGPRPAATTPRLAAASSRSRSVRARTSTRRRASQLTRAAHWNSAAGARPTLRHPDDLAIPDRHLSRSDTGEAHPRRPHGRDRRAPVHVGPGHTQSGDGVGPRLAQPPERPSDVGLPQRVLARHVDLDPGQGFGLDEHCASSAATPRDVQAPRGNAGAVDIAIGLRAAEDEGSAAHATERDGALGLDGVTVVQLACAAGHLDDPPRGPGHAEARTAVGATPTPTATPTRGTAPSRGATLRSPRGTTPAPVAARGPGGG